ncbi:MAG: FKBP-type peptidyl-prolyl cis-trans isomerase [Chitinophagaceae bacterium]
MKKLLTGIAAVCIAGSVLAQAKTVKKPVDRAAAPKSTGTVFKSQNDSLSYSIGMSLASFYKQQGITNINTVMLNRAINDIKTGKPLLTEAQMTACVNNYMQKKQAEKTEVTRKANAGIIETNHKAGEAFLAENKTKPGVVTTASGLQYQVLKEGTGPKPLPTDKVKCHYHGTLRDGTVFDSSVDRGQPVDFPVTGVIQGWVEALQLMPVGSKWKLFLPPNLAYGDNAAGPKITPGSTLIFDVELLEIVK